MTGTRNMLNTARAAGAAVDPGVKEHKEMKRKFGFTLVELLVVIAIISILAAIVTPKVQGHILRGRMTNSVAEIQGIETALTKMLTDAGKSSLRELFENPRTTAPTITPGAGTPPTLDYDTLEDDIDAYSKAFYALLRQGRNAVDPDTGLLPGDLALKAGVKDKLATSYIDADLDAWDRQYKFWAGPWKGSGPIPFRCYRPGATLEDDGSYLPYIYSETNASILDDGTPGNRNRKAEMDELIPGNPPVDEQYGFPAPKDLGIYIFSEGVNGHVDQLYVPPTEDKSITGGGDDINNWDKGEQGWTGFYS